MQTNDRANACEDVLSSRHEHAAINHGGVSLQDVDGQLNKHNRHRIVSLHIQELMVVDYFSHCTSSKILEFGCGTGRHLRNLGRLPELSVFGFEENKAILGDCEQFLGTQWINEHIKFGSFTNPLPYANKEFDIVFTSGSLSRVSPDKLGGVLQELHRICRGHILHIEMSDHQIGLAGQTEQVGLFGPHNLSLAYAQLGLNAELLPTAYFAQTPVRVLAGLKKPAFTWSPLALELFRRMEQDLQKTLDDGAQYPDLYAKVSALENEVSVLRRKYKKALDQSQFLSERIENMQSEDDQLVEKIERASVQMRALKEELRLLEQARRAETFGFEKDIATLHQQREEVAGKLALQLRDAFALLKYYRGHSAHRLAHGTLKSRFWRVLRYLNGHGGRVTHVRAIKEKNPLSQGREVWIRELFVKNLDGDVVTYPWDFVSFDSSWASRPDLSGPLGQSFVSEKGKFQIVGDDPELRFVAHPFGGRVRISYNDHSEILDLYSPVVSELRANPASKPMVRESQHETDETNKDEDKPNVVVSSSLAVKFEDRDNQFLEKLRKEDFTRIAVYCPGRLGIAHTTRNLFSCTYPFPATAADEISSISPEAISYCSEVLLTSGIKHIVFSGAIPQYIELARIMKSKDPSMRFDLLWHGNYYNVCALKCENALRPWISACQQGLIHSIGTLKKGMNLFIESLGVRSKLVLSYVSSELLAPPTIQVNTNHVGIWLSHQSPLKAPHAMLAALKLVPNCVLHGACLGAEAKEIIKELGLTTSVILERTLPHESLLQNIRETNITLNVNLADGAPLLPFESLNLGVPCLVGPSANLFEDNPYLFQHLVVPSPDRADTIAEYLKKAIEEKEEILNEYKQYIPYYNEEARQSLLDFLGN